MGPLLMEILQFQDLGDTSVISECSLGVNLVIDNFVYVASGTSPLYEIWKQSDYYLWRYCILMIWGIRVSFGCERSCSSPRRVSNFNSKVPQGGIYPHIKFERDRLNIFRVRVFTSSGSTGGIYPHIKFERDPFNIFRVRVFTSSGRTRRRRC